MRRVLNTQFFNRPTITVARDLLGKFLVRRYKGREIAAMITETEAYDGLKDMASHASRGRTPRTMHMFGPPGVWYIYFTYGMHWMLNVATREKGYPAAVLIRGVSPVRSRARVGAPKEPLGWATSNGINGPARLTKLLKIDGRLNGKPATKKSGLWIEDRGIKIPDRLICKSPRIGINYAGPYWVKRLWRFYIDIK